MVVAPYHFACVLNFTESNEKSQLTYFPMVSWEKVSGEISFFGRNQHATERHIFCVDMHAIQMTSRSTR